MSANCAYHPEISASAACMQCGVLICGDCKRRVKNKPACWRCAGEDTAPVVQLPDPEPAATPADNMPEAAQPAAAPYYAKQGPLTTRVFLKGLIVAMAISLAGGLIWEKVLFYGHSQWPYGNLILGAAIGIATKSAVGRPSNIMAVVSGLIAALGVLADHWLLMWDIVTVGLAPSHVSVDLVKLTTQVFPEFLRDRPISHWVFCGASVLMALIVPSTLIKGKKPAAG